MRTDPLYLYFSVMNTETDLSASLLKRLLQIPKHTVSAADHNPLGSELPTPHVLRSVASARLFKKIGGFPGDSCQALKMPQT